MLQQNSNQPPKDKRNNGHFSIKEGKIIVNNETGQSSVLIEDISSISWKRKFSRGPNWNYLIISLIVMFSGMFLPKSGDNFAIFVLMLFVGAIFVGLSMQALKIEWDDVIIETRGGMLMIYSVDLGKGIKEVNLIETQKRVIV